MEFDVEFQVVKQDVGFVGSYYCITGTPLRPRLFKRALIPCIVMSSRCNFYNIMFIKSYDEGFL
jgi:hypothetical protein